MGIVLKELISIKIFSLILLFKISIIIFLMPQIHSDLFLPFFLNWINDPNFQIWNKDLITNNKSPFPYGIVMFIVFLPLTYIGFYLDQFFEFKNFLYFTNFGFKFTIILFDIGILIVLLKIFLKLKNEIILYYWTSPIVLFIIYWHGQLDIIPVFLLLLSFLFLKNNFNYKSVIFFSLAVVAKHSMIISLPFILIYFLKQKLDFFKIFKYFGLFILIIFFLEIPFLLNEGYQILVMNNKEIQKLYSLNIKMETNSIIYIVPLTYFLLLYYFQRLRRINFDLLFSGMGIAFSILIFLTPSSPGWVMWIIPMLTIHQATSNYKAKFLVFIFSFSFIFFNFFNVSGSDFLNLFTWESLKYYFNFNSYFILNYSIFITSGLILSIQILRESIRFNDYYKFSVKPISIGISGDSGTGKTTLSNSLKKIFGSKFTQEIYGDDYHNWERGSKEWDNQTHLHPKSNNLLKLTNDLREMINGNSIYSKNYDHISGKFNELKIKNSSDFIIVNGLHTLFSNQLRNLFDIKIFMIMNEDLRLKLKTERDLEVRKKSLSEIKDSIAKRAPDYQSYILPQKDLANIIFEINLFDRSKINDQHIKMDNMLFNLNIKIKNCLYFQELKTTLADICKLDLNIKNIDSSSNVNIEINKISKVKNIKNVAKIIIPQFEEIVDTNAEFSDNITGIMQLIILIELVESLKRS